jgi:hypothetical protein
MKGTQAMNDNHESVEAIIKDLESKVEKLESNAYRQRLKELKLYEKVYSPDDTPSKEFPHSEEGPLSDSITRYFRYRYLKVSKEELEKIESLHQIIDSHTSSKNSDHGNGVRNFLIGLAVIVFTIGFFITIMNFSELFILGLYSLFVTLLVGGFFLGIAEIVRLLADIERKR